MFKSKGVVLGATVALAGAALLIAGMAVSTTSGAGTDVGIGNPGPSTGFPDVTGNPPASGGEQPGTQPPAGNPAGIPAGQPGSQPDAGTNAAGTGAPGSLPNAGFGETDASGSSAGMVVLLALAGAALVGAGAASVGASRRD